MTPPISEAFLLLGQLAAKVGMTNARDLPGCWEHEFGDWFFAVNAHENEIACSKGARVPPYHAYLECRGWPAGLINPYGGVMMGGGGEEDQFIADLKTEIARAA